MNWDTIKADWKSFRGEIKERWGRLTDDDMDMIDGRREQLVGMLQKRYAIEKEEAERQLKDYLEMMEREEKEIPVRR